MRKKNLLPFEKKVLAGLASCGIAFASISEKSPLGVAVSGGADSVSLLLALCAIFGGGELRVITVNHGIRSAEESGGDAEFVRDLCETLPVSCKVVEIPNGKISKIAKTQKKSVEEVARKFRYEAFEIFEREENLVSICLAHNQNDQIETILMRFLQGSVEGAGGIARVRGKFVRPLLDIPRSDIERYLCEKNQPWRTDSTNSDITFFRNKVRNVLVPVLNGHFAGWQGAVLSGSKKAASDEDFLQRIVAKNEMIETDDSLHSQKIALDRTDFFALHGSLKRRVFFSSLNKIGFGGRFPFHLFEKIASWSEEKSRSLSFENVLIQLGSDNLEISLCDSDSEMAEYSVIESGFSFLFSETGQCVHLSEISILCEADNSTEKTARLVFETVAGDVRETICVTLPVLVRSMLPSDSISLAQGGEKRVREILENWKIPKKFRSLVPVIENVRSGQLCAVMGLPFGGKNWIVEDSKLQ